MSAPRSRRAARAAPLTVDVELEDEVEEASDGDVDFAAELAITQAPRGVPLPKIGRPRKAVSEIAKAADKIHEERGDVEDLIFPVIDRMRPSKDQYDPEYCELVIKYMGRGYTLSVFAAAAGVNKEALWHWGQEHQEFVEAVQIAKLTCQRFWETMLLEVATKGTHTSGRVTAIQFALKNLAKDDWTEVQRHEVSGPGGAPLNAPASKFDTSRLTTKELVLLEQLSIKATAGTAPEGAG